MWPEASETEANTLWLPLEWILVTLALTYLPTTVSVSLIGQLGGTWMSYGSISSGGKGGESPEVQTWLPGSTLP